MIEVQVRNGNLEKAMRVLKKKVQKEGIVKEIKRRQFYMKPSEVKREAKKEGIKNFKKKMAKLPVRVASGGKAASDEDISRPDNFEGYIFPSLELLEKPEQGSRQHHHASNIRGHKILSATRKK